MWFFDGLGVLLGHKYLQDKIIQTIRSTQINQRNPSASNVKSYWSVIVYSAMIIVCWWLLNIMSRLNHELNDGNHQVLRNIQCIQCIQSTKYKCFSYVSHTSIDTDTTHDML